MKTEMLTVRVTTDDKELILSRYGSFAKAFKYFMTKLRQTDLKSCENYLCRCGSIVAMDRYTYKGATDHGTWYQCPCCDYKKIVRND